jgi:signal transduction histidine kinase
LVRRLASSPFFRFALGLPLGIAVLLALALVPVYQEALRGVEEELRIAIDAEILRLEQQYQDRGIFGLRAAIRQRIAYPLDADSVYLLADARGLPIEGNVTGWPQVEPVDGSWVRFRDARSAEPIQGKVFRVGGRERLFVGRRSPLEQFRREFFMRLATAGVGVTLLALALATAFTLRLRRRLDTIRATADRIRGGDLAERVPTHGTGDELDQLAGTLNGMLAQIDTLMASAREVSSAIAHDMRHPLSRLRNRIDELAREPALDDVTRGELEAALEELDGTLTAFAALLRLARIESGSYGPRSEPVLLDQLANDAIDLYRATAEERGLEIVAQLAPVTVTGDRDLLFQAVGNLLDNAVKYGAQRIEIALEARAGNARLTIRDEGPGLADTDRERVFDRFFRSDPSRSTPGTGLGLTLAKAIVELHGGGITLEDGRPGLKVVITLPIARGVGAEAAAA